VESAIAAAVTSVAASVPAQTDDDEKSEDAKLDLFARKVSDSVTKAIAELLNPTKKEAPADDEEEVEEEGKKVRRKRKPPVIPAPKKRSFFLFG
jgi:mevalonate pyrophosphate decarboxylase